MIAGISTYALSDFLMFAPETYFRLFELYNADVWPAQIAAGVLVPVLVALTRRPGPWRARMVLILLALCWAAVAWLFFFRHYATINLAAPWMGAGFAAQAVLLLLAAAFRGGVRFAWVGRRQGKVGLAVLLYASVVHPLIGPLAGRDWAGVELFGLTPDPTAVGTLGLMLMAAGSARWMLSVVPLLWCTASGLTYLAAGYAAGLATPALGLAVPLAMGVWVLLGGGRRNS